MAPSYRAICRFRSEVLSECGEEIFYEVVGNLHGLGEITYEHLFVDGTKLEANANKYSFVWQKSTTKYEKRAESKLEKLLWELNGVVKQDYGFQRFLHRGNKKVFTEFLIVAMGYNVNKYHNKIQQNRTGSQLHEKLSA